MPNSYELSPKEAHEIEKLLSARDVVDQNLIHFGRGLSELKQERYEIERKIWRIRHRIPPVKHRGT